MRTIKPIYLAAVGATLIAGLCAAGLGPYVRRARLAHPKTGAPLVVPGKEADGTLLHNGWRITPAGRSIPTGDMLVGGAIRPDGTLLAISNAGYGQNAVNIVDVSTEQPVARIPVPKSYNGLCWSPDGKRLYVSGGVNNSVSDIYVIEQDAAGAWSQTRGLPLGGAEKASRCAGGLAISADGATLYALNVSDNKLYALDAGDGSTRFSVAVGDHPIAIRLSKDGKRAYVASWGSSDVAVVDVSGPATAGVLDRLPTGAHPNDLALAADGRLFVSCGNDDALTVLDIDKRKVLETVRTSLTPKSPSGSTPNALALTPDGKTLYVANADNNSLCVIDVSVRGRSRVRGFIPTGWYPTAVLVSADGKKVIVGSGKGTGTHGNPARNPKAQMTFEYIGRQLNGLLSFVDPPSDAQLKAYSRQVAENTPYRDALLGRAEGSSRTAIPTRPEAESPIKYVLYIIKENRTYDQVLGDMPKGNGDPNLCLFGADVTPNHHALAEQFVLLDNLYCNGEVSQDGHPWSTSAYATDYMQRSWVQSYSGKGQPSQTPNLTNPPAGFLWEAAAKKGLSYRSYGEYQGHKSLAGHENLHFIGKGGPNQPAPGRDTARADIFIAEFKEFERTGTMPRFMVMSLGEDHTRGTTPGAFTPKAAVASNDLALGKIVEAISNSSMWKEFAIFVIEDDAQNGPDHVDSHRTVGLVISPYTKRGHVDSTMYQTASMLRTMELILGLPPLSQYDAAATPMFESFTNKADLTPYAVVPPKIDLNAKNGMAAYGARQSARMDWSDYDRIDEDTLNRILWHSIKGKDVPMPAPVRSIASGGGTAKARKADADD